MRPLGRLNKWMRTAAVRFRPQVVILLYHRIYQAETDPQLLCAHPTHFAEHLEVLRNQYVVLSLKELCERLQEKRLPKRGVAVTFDDGYADNFHNAKPLLERYEIPATVFVTTGYLGHQREFWWDELERLLMRTQTLPECLQVTLNGTRYEWHLERWAHVSEEERRLHSRWNVARQDMPTPRHQAYWQLHRLLRSLGDQEREMVLTQLRQQSEDSGNRPNGDRVMTPGEIQGLAESGLIELGAHTETHPVLAKFSIEDQRKQITESKRFLETILERKVVSFSYPYGGCSDYTPETVAIVREAGFNCACANVTGVVTRESDLFQLPRFIVRDWDGDEFTRRLREWFNG